MSEEPGLRERKRQRTRKDLIEVAHALFLEKGYEQTTLEEICREVMISVPTFFTYFASKDEIALALDHDWFERVRTKLGEPDRPGTLDVWREHVEKGIASAEHDIDLFIRIRKMQQAVDVLVRARLQLLYGYYDSLRAALAVDGDGNVDDVHLDLLATMLTFGNNNAINWWVDRGGAGDFRSRALAVVDLAEEWFEQLQLSP